MHVSPLRVGATHDALWTSLFPAVQTSLATSLTAAAVPEVAEFVTGMILLNTEQRTRRRPEAELDRLFQLFACSVRPILSCNFLQLFLQGGPESARRRKGRPEVVIRDEKRTGKEKRKRF